MSATDTKVRVIRSDVPPDWEDQIGICLGTAMFAGDPQQLFITDLESQSRILRCLQSSAESVQDYLEHKPQRDKEPLPAKQYLLERLRRSMDAIDGGFSDLAPRVIDQIRELDQMVKAQIQNLSPELVESRAHLVNIVKAYESIAVLDLKNMKEVRINQEKLDDVLIMISDL